MSSQVIAFSYGKNHYAASVERRERKTLAISVLPDCTIQAIAPLQTPDILIEERLRKRARWINRQLAYFAQFQPRTPERKFVSGETHLYLGRKYRLKLIPGETSSVKLKAGHFHITCKDSDFSLTGKLLWRWYREKAEAKFDERLAYCLAKFKGHERPELAIRQLKKRWGSLTPQGLLTLNLDLIRAPVECIDYVIIHELCHVEEPHHGNAFTSLLEQKLNGWQAKKHKLELRLS